MTLSPTRRSTLKLIAAGVAGAMLPSFGAGRADAAVTALKQSIAEAAARDEGLSTFYRKRNYKPVFVGKGDSRRCAALLRALERAGDHGLPVGAYDADGLKAAMKDARTPSDMGRVEVEAAKRMLDFADHMRSGVLDPRSVDNMLVMDVPRYDRASTIDAFAKSNPAAFLRKMAPRKPEYVRLQKEKLKLEKLLARGGWGDKVQAKTLKPGETGGAVIQLRNRLIRMGYLRKSASQTYDAKMQAAVQSFQVNHGLAPDGVAGGSTIAQINQDVQDRLQQVLVAMERQRWNSRPMEKHHIWVNIPDFHVDIIKNGKSTFRSRVVVGKNTSDRRTPEFSDKMEFMVVNPSWYVPRSIVTKEYLPLMQRNRGAARQLQIIGRNGRPVNRANINFAQYNARNFPYSMKQPPSKGNALGLVKFMFPNKHNIYLHDTPSKSLFGQEMRAFSHGCIRVHKPFDFAYALLANQESNPEGFFQNVLRTGQERRVDLREPMPVHIAYYTAWVDAKGQAHYRNDVYNRDSRIFDALSRAGVSLGSVAS
ncbi:L,D-transpeptidase family protein [Litoreibacter arenae]|uniref:L,D-transpeptidase YcbB n=1 Tax=Litoreibacter arenae DSM 19593 TaxID=1123360 RepID=S9RLT1_9RHOB|nr:L,D-transpeptidase family protein [Litoreibacter arenae]EPX79060.1 L,D-transpeptidase YcbB [Litoreibacter arenae DSM 19593]